MKAASPQPASATPGFLTVDTADFTRRGDFAQGSIEPRRLSRLLSSVQAMEESLVWSLRGGIGSSGDGLRVPLLHLELSGTVGMTCVRCLEPVRCQLAVKRSFRLAVSEAQAEREDREDEDYDVLVGDRRFDLGALIEDEALLALPFAPSHAQCQVPGIVSGAGEDQFHGQAEAARDRAGASQAAGGVDLSPPGLASPEPSTDRPHPFAALGRLKRRS